MASNNSVSVPPAPNPSIHVQPIATQSQSQSQQMHHPTPKTKQYSLSPLNFTPGAPSRSASSVLGDSIPSSPTSIHSSSSAIFERDIEVPLTATSPLHHALKDPHHTARAVAHEPLESGVPSVLTAAVAALGEADHGSPAAKKASFDEISVIGPAPKSPMSIKNGLSRSPSPHIAPLPNLPSSGSPTPSRMSRSTAPQRLGNADPSLTSISASLSNTSTPHLLANDSTTPSVIGIVPPTPNANSFGFTASPRTASPPSATASPLVVTPPLPGLPSVMSGGSSANHSPSRPVSMALSLEELSLAPLVTTTADSPLPVPADLEPIALSLSVHPRPPSPHASSIHTSTAPSPITANSASAVSKRLSFISYNDLLNSTPVSSVPLSSFTSNGVEPPHQVDLTVRDGRSNGSRVPSVSRSPVSEIFTEEPASHHHTHDVGAKGGGEWEREGFGTGLEERLEAALKEHQARDPTSATSSVFAA